MKLFLIKVSLVIVVVVSGLAVLEYKSRQLDESFYKVKKEYIEENYDQVEGLIFGPSHIWKSINPEWLDDNVASLAFSASAIDIDYKLFNQYKDAPNLQYVFLDFSAGYKERYQINDWIRAKKLYYYFGVRSDQFQLSELFYVHYPIYDDLEQLFDESKREKPEAPMNKWGFFTKIPNRKNSFKRAKYDKEKIKKLSFNRKVKDRHNLEVFDEYIAEQNISYIKDIVNTCKAKNVKVIFFSPPKYNIYNDLLMEAHLERRKKLVDELVDNKNVFFWNYDRIIEDDPTMFYNINHVNIKGAKYVTEKVNQQLKTIGID